MAEHLGIIHVDMDAFFASIEQLDNPDLRGKPVVVAGSPHSRGVVAAASYEARRYGIFSALPSAEAYRRCPHAVFVPGRMARYQEVSAQIMSILRAFTPLVEPLSLDEAYCDLDRDGPEQGRAIKDQIRRGLGLTASVGVSYNKFLAKLASDMDKPDGFTIIDRDRARLLLPSLPVRKLWGVGPRTSAWLESLGIQTAGQLAAYPVHLLEQNLGSRVSELVQLALGIDHRRVAPHSPAKSIGEEVTLPVDVSDPRQLAEQLDQLAHAVEDRLDRHGLEFRTLTLKARYADFTNVTRSHSFPDYRREARDMIHQALALLSRLDVESRALRLIGLSVSGLQDRGDACQLALPIDQLDDSGVNEL